jgi:hypothetical protein
MSAPVRRIHAKGFDVVMTSPSLRKFRNAAAAAQGWICCYCGLPMGGEGSPCQAALEPLGKAFEASAEHLVPRCEGGGDTRGNIAAAHECCNRSRHRRRRVMTPERFAVFVQRRVGSDRWFCSPALELLRSLGGQQSRKIPPKR